MDLDQAPTVLRRVVCTAVAVCAGLYFLPLPDPVLPPAPAGSPSGAAPPRSRPPPDPAPATSPPPRPRAARSPDRVTLVVEAPPLLRDAFAELTAAFQSEDGKTSLLLRHGTGDGLERGPDRRDVEVTPLAAGGGEARVLGEARLVLATSRAAAARVPGLAALATPRLRVVLPSEGTPAADALDRMIASHAPPLPEGFREALVSNCVRREPQGREALAPLLYGQADAAVVLSVGLPTRLGSMLHLADLPDVGTARVRYAATRVPESPHPERAGRLLAFLEGTRAREILARHGLRAAPAP